jgi:putative methionine-R-sulfoxide reductase with GAF domain
MFTNDSIYGVLDIDSRKFKRFSAIDKRFLEQIAVIIMKYIKRAKDL